MRIQKSMQHYCYSMCPKQFSKEVPDTKSIFSYIFFFLPPDGDEIIFGYCCRQSYRFSVNNKKKEKNMRHKQQH